MRLQMASVIPPLSSSKFVANRFQTRLYSCHSGHLQVAYLKLMRLENVHGLFTTTKKAPRGFYKIKQVTGKVLDLNLTLTCTKLAYVL